MYEYRPRLRKQKERLCCAVLGITGVGLFLCSRIPGIWFPSFIQLFAVLFLVGAIAIAGAFLLRSFCYTVAPREGRPEAAMDLTVTEQYGKRLRTVCILSTAEILRAIPCTGQTRAERRRLTDGSRIYRYISALWGDERYLLEVLHEEERFFVIISANNDLIESIFAK